MDCTQPVSRPVYGDADRLPVTALKPGFDGYRTVLPRSSLRRPADFCPDGLTAGIHHVPELVGQGGDDGQPAPVLVVRAAIIWIRMPFAAAGVGYLDARPVGSSANGDGELASQVTGRGMADRVADEFGGDELHVVGTRENGQGAP